ARRWKALSGTEAVAQQDVDVQVAGAVAQQALVQAARHEVGRYQALEAFKRIVAPFDGVVTSRRTDVGSFVNAAGGDAGSTAAASELFTVADIHRLRVYVSVPEDYAEVLKPGLTATLRLPQFPNRTFEAHYETTAGAFSPQSRSVTTQLSVDNADHAIWPGTFANVHFTVPSDAAVLVVPEQALMFRAQGMQVALVDAQNRVHLQNVTLGLNLGRNVQVVGGLRPEDRMVNDPSAGLLEGETVQVTQPAKGYAAEAEPAAKAPSASEEADVR
ncbi:MAG: efflux RND transporter periplasmic adaptor subunit, partial [Janthinobacterium lividum]